MEVEPELEPDPSSEQESHSPYRKRVMGVTISECQQSTSSNNTTNTVIVQPTQTTTTTTTTSYCKEKTNTALGAGNVAANATQHRNGHYELVDTSKPPSIKRNKPKTNCSPLSQAGPWPKCVHQCSVKQPASSTTYDQKQIRAHHKSLSNRISSLKRENKTTQTLSIVVGGFIVCWLPFFIYYLITPFLPHESVSGTVTNCLTWLGWFNSAMNPCIYAFYSVDFRAAFWRLTFRRFFKNSVKAPYSSNALSIRR